MDNNLPKRYVLPEKSTHPTKHGRYLVQRKDGKTHLENWNGTGWAYNNGVIIAYIGPIEELFKHI